MAAIKSNAIRITDGAFSFEGGVDSNSITTIASQLNQNGLRRDQLAWAANASMRGGGIYPRSGWIPILQNPPWSGLFQGAFVYHPAEGNPYHIAQIGGRIYQIRSDTDFSVVDLSAVFGLTNPAEIEEAFFCQGEIFLVIQAGDYSTLPLFWDGTTLRRSVGLKQDLTIYNVTWPNMIIFPNGAPGTEFSFALGAMYPGSIGDTVYWTWTTGAVPIGTFIVTNIAGVTITLATTVFRGGPLAGISPGYGTMTVVEAFTPELPAAGPMDYFMGRLWYAFGRSYTAGDIVRGPSGTVGTPYFLSLTVGGICPLADVATGGDLVLLGAGQTAALFLVQIWNSAISHA